MRVFLFSLLLIFSVAGQTYAACPTGGICEGNTLIGCHDGYYKKGSQCATCNPAIHVCSGGNLTGCTDGYFYSRELTACMTCVPGRHICSNGKLTGCSDGYFMDSSTGLPYSGTNCYSCDSYGAICNGNTVTGCIEGYKYSGKRCYKCSSSEICSNGKFMGCIDGYFNINNGGCGQCIEGKHRCVNGELVGCEEGWYIDNKDCLKCEVGKYVCSGGLFRACEPGYYKKQVGGHSYCLECPPNAECYQSAIHCNENYYLAAGECHECDPTRHVCEAGFITSCIGPRYFNNAKTCTECPTGYDYNTDVGKTNVSQCQVHCGGGSYVATKNKPCTDVGSGYWAPESTIAYGGVGMRNACPLGTKTLGHGSGADDENDCGQILHFGNHTLHLRAVKTTSPSLALKVNEKIFYGSMAPQGRGFLRAKIGNTIYSIFDEDSAE